MKSTKPFTHPKQDSDPALCGLAFSEALARIPVSKMKIFMDSPT